MLFTSEEIRGRTTDLKKRLDRASYCLSEPIIEAGKKIAAAILDGPKDAGNTYTNIEKKGTQCCAFGCKKRRSGRSTMKIQRSDSEGSDDEESVAKRCFPITFHGFPLDPERLQKWIANIRREGWAPSKHSKICSDHFKEEFMDRTGQIVRLKENAIPTRFKLFPSYLKKDSSNRRSPIKRKSTTEESSTVVKKSKAAMDHTYCIQDSPRKLKLKLNQSIDKMSELKSRLKISNQKSKRLRTKVTSLKSIIQELKNKNLISAGCQELLTQSFSGVPLALLSHSMRSKTGTKKGIKYSEELRSFALTLQFYSTKAYEFVRKTFNLALPHPEHIRKWYARISGEPGFTKQAFDAIHKKVENAKLRNNKVVCSLMLDEMCIKRHISWDGEKFRGFVDLGNDINDDGVPEAKDALVLMAVCVNGSWKVPLAYFFINGLDGRERANIIRVCLRRLGGTGAQVVSLTCDGPSCHFTMLTELGASLDPVNIKPYFVYLSNSGNKIFVLLDTCHMLKLVRNTLAETGILIDGESGKILWQYIVKLQNSKSARERRA